MLLNWFKRRENILALCIALVVLVLHLIIIDQVDRDMFDEAHYIPEAKAILEGEELDNLEHPPLGKLFIAAGIDSFGDNPWGWRTFSVLFGVASIILFYLVCQNLTANRYIPLIATFIFAFENQSFVQSSVAMLDVFSLAFMLASFWLYLRGNFIWSGIILALAALAKTSGILGGAVILMHWLIVSGMGQLILGFVWSTLRKLFTKDLASIPQQLVILMISTLKNLIHEPMLTHLISMLKVGLAAIVFFLVLMPVLDYVAMGEWKYPWDRIEFMQDNLSVLTFSNTQHQSMSYPWEWITSIETQWFWYNPTYQSNPNWNLWIFIIPAICYALYGAIKRNSICLFALMWFVGTYLSWILIYLITDRIMFRFYFYPTIGSICLIMGFLVYQMLTSSQLSMPSIKGHKFVLPIDISGKKTKWIMRIIAVAFLISHLVLFVLMSPYSDLRVGQCCPE